MSSKPLINGKGVDKPFCSPFRNVKGHSNEENKSNPNTPKSDSLKTPLRVSMSKRLVFQSTPPAKKLRLNNENSDPKNTEHRTDLADKSSEAFKNITEDTKLYRSDLDALMKRINEKQQHVNEMETELNHKREKKTEELEATIEKWTSACRRALIDYQNDLQENHGQSIGMAQIMSSLGINKNLISFPDDTDTF